jgi:hypothetical protein
MTSVHDVVVVGRLDNGGHVVAGSVRGRVDVGPATAAVSRYFQRDADVSELEGEAAKSSSTA